MKYKKINKLLSLGLLYGSYINTIEPKPIDCYNQYEINKLINETYYNIEILKEAIRKGSDPEDTKNDKIDNLNGIQVNLKEFTTPNQISYNTGSQQEQEITTNINGMMFLFTGLLPNNSLGNINKNQNTMMTQIYNLIKDTDVKHLAIFLEDFAFPNNNINQFFEPLFGFLNKQQQCIVITITSENPQNIEKLYLQYNNEFRESKEALPLINMAILSPWLESKHIQNIFKVDLLFHAFRLILRNHIYYMSCMDMNNSNEQNNALDQNIENQEDNKEICASTYCKWLNPYVIIYYSDSVDLPNKVAALLKNCAFIHKKEEGTNKIIKDFSPALAEIELGNNLFYDKDKKTVLPSLDGEENPSIVCYLQLNKVNIGIRIENYSKKENH